MPGLGRDDKALAQLSSGCAVAYFVALTALTPLMGAAGASLAHVVFAGLWLGGALRLFLRATAPDQSQGSTRSANM